MLSSRHVSLLELGLVPDNECAYSNVVWNVGSWPRGGHIHTAHAGHKAGANTALEHGAKDLGAIVAVYRRCQEAGGHSALPRTCPGSVARGTSGPEGDEGHSQPARRPPSRGCSSQEDHSRNPCAANLSQRSHKTCLSWPEQEFQPPAEAPLSAPRGLVLLVRWYRMATLGSRERHGDLHRR